MKLEARDLLKAGIDPRRVSQLNELDVRPGAKFALYWMQASQREGCNHALELALLLANGMRLPLLVAFCLADNYPGANLRHYAFMAEGLANVSERLAKRGIAMKILRGSPPDEIERVSMNAAFAVTDSGHAHVQRAWRESLAKSVSCPLLEVETNLVVPVDVASMKEEYAARTIRPKLGRLVPEFLAMPARQPVAVPAKVIFKCETANGIMSGLRVDKSVKPSQFFKGGEDEARRLLDVFIKTKLKGYDSDRNDPGVDGTSRLSPYLHFGHISPLEIALSAAAKDKASAEPFLEELIVRRELAFNFTRRNRNYDNVNCLPDWTLKTLRERMRDKRETLYSLEELEAAKTSDEAWNAAQMEMVKTGRMHGYMRMYWGKRVIEWTSSPEEAYGILVALNDKYELDGRDPNGYAGVAWCFGKHDRPWTPSPIFGTVRRMTQSGLRRKFDLDAYIRKAAEL